MESPRISMRFGIMHEPVDGAIVGSPIRSCQGEIDIGSMFQRIREAAGYRTSGPPGSSSNGQWNEAPLSDRNAARLKTRDYQPRLLFFDEHGLAAAGADDFAACDVGTPCLVAARHLEKLKTGAVGEVQPQVAGLLV